MEKTQPNLGVAEGVVMDMPRVVIPEGTTVKRKKKLPYYAQFVIGARSENERYVLTKRLAEEYGYKNKRCPRCSRGAITTLPPLAGQEYETYYCSTVFGCPWRSDVDGVRVYYKPS